MELSNPGWGLVFYSVKSKLIAYYRLDSKEPTASSTLDNLGNFIAEHRVPRIIITDINRVLGEGNKWKHYLGRMFNRLRLSKPDKHNQNSVERAIKKFKAGITKIRNACGMRVLA